MDPVNIIQLVFAGTTVLVLGRVGLAVARYLERRLPALTPRTRKVKSGSGRSKTSAPCCGMS